MIILTLNKSTAKLNTYILEFLLFFKQLVSKTEGTPIRKKFPFIEIIYQYIGPSMTIKNTTLEY